MTFAHEIFFDGIVGPTHNYGGLSFGNEASIESTNDESNPKQAALQGLAKMKFLMDLGVKQAVLPPHPRPHLKTLNRLGFQGTKESIYDEAKRKLPWIWPFISSASSMWSANSFTSTPSIDSSSKKVQFTPANLVSTFHRSIEGEVTGKILKAIFPNPIFFEHHDPLPAHMLFGDEGSANHARFGKTVYGPGVHLFVYGNSRISDEEVMPQKYPARQSLEASQAIRKLHEIYEKQVVYAQQNPKAIDAGVFHKDVISVGHLNLFFFHEEAFFDTDKVIEELQKKVQASCDTDLVLLKVSKDDLTLEEVVKSYLFNSQIVSLPDGTLALIAPSECLEMPRVNELLKKMTEEPESPISHIHFLNLRQSMKNGGGPACLTNRVILNDKELEEMNPHILLTQDLYGRLVEWVNTNYRESLFPSELNDIKLERESESALRELSEILKLDGIYD